MVMWRPTEYQGYDYETVQIGEQCWFAENLRSENYLNGDAILSSLSEMNGPQECWRCFHFWRGREQLLQLQPQR